MQRHYRAFISYSHADERWAGWLQRALEHYRVPRRLRRDRPGLPARLNPVFRDREELASSDDLSESIRLALQRSDALLVICSPASAASRWVNEEIRQYRRLVDNPRVLCLMVDGQPDPAAPDCAFPPALLQGDDGRPLPEPLAADARVDGKRGALLKLAAGLLGVGVDALRQRDQQRRLRVMGAVTAVALTVSLVTVLLAVAAVRARDEAELRRTQAERLIEFMLVDLREQLEPIGRLNILDRVGNQAMGYFSALGGLGTDEEVYSRAMALRQIGEVRFSQGQLGPAADAFGESRELARRLHEAAPQDNDRLFELGQSEFWVAYAALERGDTQAAETGFLAYSEIANELSSRDPGDSRYLLERLFAAVNLGGLDIQLDRPRSALPHISDSVEIGRLLVRQQPDKPEHRAELARGLSWLGSVRTELGDFAGAQAAFREGYELLQPLHAAGEDAAYSREFGDMALLLADGLAATGEIEAAATLFLDTREMYASLVEADPDNALWREGLYRALEGAGQMRLAAGDRDAAAELLQTAAEGFDGLHAAEPASQVFRLRLARALAETAWIDTLAGRSQAAEAAAVRVSGLLGGTAQADGESLVSGIRAASALDLCGAVWAAGGDAQRAESAWRDALQRLPAERGSPIARALRARLLSRLGRTPEAQQELDAIAASGLRDSRYLPVATVAGAP